MGMVALLAACGGGGEPQRKRVVEDREFVCPAAGRQLETRDLDRSMLPSIWKILNDDNRRGCWGASLLAIGHIGADDAFLRLRSFIEGRGTELALAEDLVILQQAYLALGNMVRDRTNAKNSDLALDYLIWSTDPLNWEKLSADWRLDAVMRRELIRVLTTSAVKALGISGAEEARQHLLQMAMDSADRRSFRFKYQVAASANDVVIHLINVHVLPPGRVAFATAEVMTTLKSAGDADLRSLAQRVHQDAMEAYNLERAWLAARRGEEGFLRAVQKADSVADARLSGLHGQLESLRHLLDSPEAQEGIERVEKVIFPEGPLALINAEVGDQVRRALAALAVLEERFHDDLVRLKLVDHVRTAREAHVELDKALKLGTSGKGYETVIVKRSELQTSLRVLLATVVSRFPGWHGGDREMQHKVLGPILDQDDQVGSYLRRLVPVRDIDPSTGQELAPLVDEGAATASRSRIPSIRRDDAAPAPGEDPERPEGMDPGAGEDVPPGME
ncbi:MAG: hypothetical protein KC549_06525 [Myxococcales bacterium]|nr:hypothetical protein [Myxococcales bacterium]